MVSTVKNYNAIQIIYSTPSTKMNTETAETSVIGLNEKLELNIDTVSRQTTKYFLL